MPFGFKRSRHRSDSYLLYLFRLGSNRHPRSCADVWQKGCERRRPQIKSIDLIASLVNLAIWAGITYWFFVHYAELHTKIVKVHSKNEPEEG